MIPATSAATISGAAQLPYQWVAVGVGGILYTSTSTTASSWTSRTSSFSTTDINSVASNGSDLYVAVGASGKIASSPDGITWTQRTSGTTNTLNGVAYGGGYWVIVGNGQQLLYSTNGTTWSSTSGWGAAGDFNCVAYGNGLWAFGNNTGSLWTATNPSATANWTSRTSTLSQFDDFNGGLHYYKGQSIWIGGHDSGTTGALASSTDGITWTARTSSLNFDAGYRTGNITSNGSVSVQGGRATTFDVQSSTDGISWTNRTPAVTYNVSTYGFAAASDQSNLMVLIGYVAVGDTSHVQSSSDGVTWTDRNNIVSPGIMLGLCHSSGTPSIR